MLVAGVDKALGKTNYANGIDEKDFLLCFLPLAHILEFVYELCSILWGGTIGYATVKTLTEASTRNCKGDIKEFRPTILVGYFPSPSSWLMVVFQPFGSLSARGSSDVSMERV